MSFEEEAEMYPILEKWLLERDEKPCEHVIMDKYRFSFAGKSYRADLVGLYESDGVKLFTGVEVKKSVRFSQTALRQAEALKVFCDETYIAVPKKEFNDLESRVKEEILSLVHSKGIGLILAPKRGLPTIKHSTKSTQFRMDIYQQTLQYFNDDSDSFDLTQGTVSSVLCQDLFQDLSEYTSESREKSHEDLFNQEWHAVSTPDGAVISHQFGHIRFEKEKVVFQVDASDLSTEIMMTDSKSFSDEVESAIHRFNAQKWLQEVGISEPPYLLIKYSGLENDLSERRVPFEPDQGALKMDVTILTDKELVFELGVLLNRFEIDSIKLILDVNRERFLTVNDYSIEYMKEQIMDRIVFVYSVLAFIVDELEWKQSNDADT